MKNNTLKEVQADIEGMDILKDGEMKSGWKEGWRIVKDVNLPRKETYSDNRYKKLP